MKIKTAEFIKSNTDVKKLPKPVFPEYAFIGRSNVGKSSLINMLTQRKNLAMTSSKPGKTRLINHFIINKQWYLVDLPGYGYAKTSKKERRLWAKFIEDYLLTRQNLMCVFVLIDSRLEPQKTDIEFINFLGINGIPLCLIFTKSDKISHTKTNQTIAKMKRELAEYWEEFPKYFVTSARTAQGREQILDFIEQTNQLFDKTKIL